MRDILSDIIAAASLFGAAWIFLIFGHAAGF